MQDFSIRSQLREIDRLCGLIEHIVGLTQGVIEQAEEVGEANPNDIQDAQEHLDRVGRELRRLWDTVHD